MRKTITLLSIALFAIDVPAISIYLMWQADPACSQPTGALDIEVNGGTPPYAYVWNNGATTQDLSGLAPGYYEVTVTDALGAQATMGWTLTSTSLSSPESAQDGHSSCVGSMSGQVQVIEWGINGTPPYTYSPPPDGYDPQGDPYFVFIGTPPGSTVQIEVTDAMGCTGTLTQYILAPQINGGTDMQLTSVQGSCSTGNGGMATITNIYDGNFFGPPDGYVFNDQGATIDFIYGVGNTVTLTGLAPGSYQFYRDWDPSNNIMAYDCSMNPYDRIDFTVPDLGPDCGSVSGMVFIDNDQDCTQDAAEVGVPFQVLEIMPGPQYIITDADGSFAYDIVDGSYTIAQTDPTLIQMCPANAPIPFIMASAPVVITMADSSTVPLDLDVQLQSGPMRPGFAGAYHARVRNLSAQLSGLATITFDLDADLVFTSAVPAPTTVNGNTITWDVGAFAALQMVDLSIHVQVPAATSLGTPLASTLSVQNTLTESDLANNTSTLNAVVVGSYDPNDKRGTTISNVEGSFIIDQDEWIDYTIRFQNTGTDTAFTVVITDTLSAVLDMASFEQGVASHPFSISFKSDRVVEWRFENILLPDSNVNEAASHGFVSFRIKPHLPILPGTTIENIANIYFDFNPPVITEPCVVVATINTSIPDRPIDDDLMLFPQPTSGIVTIAGLDPSVALREMRIYSIDGHSVLIQSTASDQRIFDASTLKSGRYIAEFMAEDGRSARKPLMIVR